MFFTIPEIFSWFFLWEIGNYFCIKIETGMMFATIFIDFGLEYNQHITKYIFRMYQILAEMLNVIQFVCVILDSYYKWNIFGQFFISNLFNVFPHFNVSLFLHILTHLDFTNCTFVVVPLDEFSQCIYFFVKKVERISNLEPISNFHSMAKMDFKNQRNNGSKNYEIRKKKVISYLFF